MSVSLTGYWEKFVQQLIASGRYNNQSEVIRAGLRALEEKEVERDVKEFERIFSDGKEGEPPEEFIEETIRKQKAFRKARRR